MKSNTSRIQHGPRPNTCLQTALRQVHLCEQLVASQRLRIVMLEETDGGPALINARRLLLILGDNLAIQQRRLDELRQELASA